MILSVEKVTGLLLVLAAQQGVLAGHRDAKHAVIPESFKQMKNLRQSFPNIQGTQRTATKEERAAAMNSRGQPRPLSSFADNKLWGARKAESHIAIEDLHENEVGDRQLHGNKNNFVTLNFHDDANCENMVESHAIVLGECFEVLNDDTAKSFTVKVNNKLNTVAELVYNNHECRGVPDSIIDLTKVFGVSGYDQCSEGATISYFDTFPDINALPYGVAYTYSFSPDYETCYERFDWGDFYAANMCLEGHWVVVDYCASSYSVSTLHFDNLDCSGSYWASWDWVGQCYPDEYLDSADDSMPSSLVSVTCHAPPPPTESPTISTSPTEAPTTPPPTVAPHSYDVTCEAYSTTGASQIFYGCSVDLCGGDSIIVHTHDAGASCYGDQLFRFYAPASSSFYTTYDDYGGTLCPYFGYSVPAGTACQSYLVDQGCYGSSESPCGGTTVITVTTTRAE